MKKIYEDIKKVFDSKIFIGFLYGVGLVIIMALVFAAGISVGFRKASFGRAWGENYERNFGMMGPGRMFNLNKENFPNAHGANGKIIKIQLPTIIVHDRDNTEKVVLIKDDTKIQQMMQNYTAKDLKVDDFVVVIGNPNEQGQIEAKFIRLMPPIFPSSTNLEPVAPQQ